MRLKKRYTHSEKHSPTEVFEGHRGYAPTQLENREGLSYP